MSISMLGNTLIKLAIGADDPVIKDALKSNKAFRADYLKATAAQGGSVRVEEILDLARKHGVSGFQESASPYSAQSRVHKFKFNWKGVLKHSPLLLGLGIAGAVTLNNMRPKYNTPYVDVFEQEDTLRKAAAVRCS